MSNLYKVLNTDGTPHHGGQGKWPLPNGKPGDWLTAQGDLEPCRNGLHLCRAGDLLSWLGPSVWLAETRGSERVVCDDKIVVREARLIERLCWDDRVARLFAADCAERALVRERRAGREPDPRLWAAVEVARRFANGEATREDLAAAWAAAWDAARDAAWAAALDAAWDAAWAAARAAANAAWAAARAADGAAARDAERKWQTRRLLDYLHGRRTA